MPANPYERTLRKVSDPLRDETRKVRKTLLVWSLAAVALTVGRLFPTEISALGLKITSTSTTTLLALLAAIIAYHLLAFAAYASADVAHWYVNHWSTEWEDDVANYEKYKQELLSRSKLSAEDREFMEEHERRLGSLWRGEALKTYERLEKAAPVVSLLRATIDFVLPALAGAVALYLVVCAWRSAP